MEEMSIAMQNYLELIYELSLDGKKARVSDIAKQLNQVSIMQLWFWLKMAMLYMKSMLM